MHRWTSASLIALALGTSPGAFAADLTPPPVPVFTEVGPNLTRWEIRGGVLGSTWGPESGELYLNGEIIAPKFYRLQGWYDFLIPRLRVGAMGNLAGGTSYVDGGVMWTVDYQRYFVDFFLGGAVHDGQINGHYSDPTRNKLGCRALYHVGWNVGYQIDVHWNVEATFDHVSDGAGTLSDCRENQGVTAVGLRLGYAF